MTARRVSLGACLVLALVALPLLLRNGLAIASHVPFDPNEGWNAAHAMAARLYPLPGSWMVNNYPPLSFYMVRAVAALTGDAVVAGRIIAFASFLLACAGIAAVARQMKGNGVPAALFFAATLLVASNYVGINDPQMLGHAVQMGALLLLLRGRVTLAALLFAASLFVKHNLLALPLACGLWLCLNDRRAAGRFIGAGLAACMLGLLAFRLAYGVQLWTVLASPRLSSFANLRAAVANLWWAPLPLLAAFGLRPPWRDVCLGYAGVALLLGLAFAMGDGVDANSFFDLAIACALILGLTSWPFMAAASAVPLAAVLALSFSDNNFFHTRAFALQSAGDITFLKTHPGPALCDQLSLCLWAGKSAEIDVFNIGEAFKTGTRDPAALTALVESRHFAVLQMENRDALGPQVSAAIARAYRTDHSDDNGTFLVPRRALSD